MRAPLERQRHRSRLSLKPARSFSRKATRGRQRAGEANNNSRTPPHIEAQKCWISKMFGLTRVPLLQRDVSETRNLLCLHGSFLERGRGGRQPRFFWSNVFLFLFVFIAKKKLVPCRLEYVVCVRATSTNRFSSCGGCSTATSRPHSTNTQNKPGNG